MLIEVLLITGGHPFARKPFLAVFESMDGVRCTHVEQPAAQACFDAERAAPFDVFVFYDMPGIEFRPGEDPPARFPAPPPKFVADFEALLAAGKGFVFLHHAIAGWPAWERYAEILGGRFHYQPARLRGRDYPDSGYRLDFEHRVEVLQPEHPISEGLGHGFDLRDELYLSPVFEDEVVPLFRSRARFEDDAFFSADRAIRGHLNDREGWSHPPGSSLVGWMRREKRSPLVYLQFGDGPSSYANEAFRRVLSNAIRWTGSPEAGAWADGPCE